MQINAMDYILFNSFIVEFHDAAESWVYVYRYVYRYLQCESE